MNTDHKSKSASMPIGEDGQPDPESSSPSAMQVSPLTSQTAPAPQIYTDPAHPNNIAPKQAFHCNICSYSSSRKYKLQMHIKFVHLASSRHHCLLCDFKSNNRDSLVNHWDSHHPEMLKYQQLNPIDHRCELCRKTLGSKNQLKVHVGRFHSQDLTCHVCSLVAWTPGILETHYLTEHGRQAFGEHIATQCKRIILKISTQKGSPPYKCCYCHRKCYGDKVSLRDHIIFQHFKIPQYHCDLCSYECVSLQRMRQHQKNIHPQALNFAEILLNPTRSKEIRDIFDKHLDCLAIVRPSEHAHFAQFLAYSIEKHMESEHPTILRVERENFDICTIKCFLSMTRHFYEYHISSMVCDVCYANVVQDALVNPKLMKKCLQEYDKRSSPTDLINNETLDISFEKTNPTSEAGYDTAPAKNSPKDKSIFPADPETSKESLVSSSRCDSSLPEPSKKKSKRLSGNVLGYSCSICQKTFLNKVDLIQHIKFTHMISRFKCFSCSFKSSSVVKMHQHINQYYKELQSHVSSSENERNNLHGSQGEMDTSSRKSLTWTENVVLSYDKISDTNDKNIETVVLTEFKITEQSFNMGKLEKKNETTFTSNHNILETPVIEKTVASDKLVSMTQVARDRGSSTFFCFLCSNIFCSMADLQNHVLCSHSTKVFCSLCNNLEFENLNLLQNHFVASHGQTVWVKLPALKKHLGDISKINTKQKQAGYKCQFCDKESKFQCAKSLNLHHKKSHQNVNSKKYQCSLCSFNTLNLLYLRAHINSQHNPKKTSQKANAQSSSKNIKRRSLPKNCLKNGITNLKPAGFDCFLCGLPFVSVDDLLDHLTNNKGHCDKATPFFCTLCADFFLHKDGMETHWYERHRSKTSVTYNINSKSSLEYPASKNFPCRYCPQCLKSEQMLTSHISETHPNVYYCLKCRYSCENQKTMFFHVKAVHKISQSSNILSENAPSKLPSSRLQKTLQKSGDHDHIFSNPLNSPSTLTSPQTSSSLHVEIYIEPDETSASFEFTDPLTPKESSPPKSPLISEGDYPFSVEASDKHSMFSNYDTTDLAKSKAIALSDPMYNVKEEPLYYDEINVKLEELQDDAECANLCDASTFVPEISPLPTDIKSENTLECTKVTKNDLDSSVTDDVENNAWDPIPLPSNCKDKMLYDDENEQAQVEEVSLMVDRIAKDPDTSKLQCFICAMYFKCQSVLKQHVLSAHLNIQPFQCGHCDHTVLWRSDLRNHSHRGLPRICVERFPVKALRLENKQEVIEIEEDSAPEMSQTAKRRKTSDPYPTYLPAVPQGCLPCSVKLFS